MRPASRQLYYRDLISEDVLATEQNKLKAERRAAERLRATATAQLDDVQDALELAIQRIEGIQRAYHEGTPLERRILNQAIFERINVIDNGKVVDTKLTPVYAAIAAWQPGFGQPNAGQSQKADVWPLFDHTPPGAIQTVICIEVRRRCEGTAACFPRLAFSVCIR